MGSSQLSATLHVSIGNRSQIAIVTSGIVAKFRFKYQTNLIVLFNFYSVRNHQKTYGFLMISGE